jgi:hypothetical protein
MARHLFFAIILIGIGGFLNSPARAVPDAAKCEDRAASCVGRCVNPGGGTNSNRCMGHCDRQAAICLVRAYDSARRW